MKRNSIGLEDSFKVLMLSVRDLGRLLIIFDNGIPSKVLFKVSLN